MNNSDDKIPDINLATKTALKAKINEVKKEIPSTNNLATNTALTAFENKIPNVNNLVKNKTITQEFMKLKKKSFIIIMINMLLLQDLIG